MNKVLNYLLHIPNPAILIIHLISGIVTAVILASKETYKVNNDFINR